MHGNSNQNPSNPQDNQKVTVGQENSTDDLSKDESTDPTRVMKSPHVLKKYGGKKILATILGIIILMGAVATGTYLVKGDDAGDITISKGVLK